MGKGKKKTSNDPITVEFPRTGNIWIDAGTVGLYRILIGDKKAYMTGKLSKENPYTEVKADLRDDLLVVSGLAEKVQRCLEWAYDRLIDAYYNKSSAKQESEKGSYNFYYDSQNEKKPFVEFPKVKAVGAASLLFDKAARPSAKQEAWGDAPDAGGKLVRTPGRMPPAHAELQGQLDEFLRVHGLKPGPPAGLLIDGPNQVRPKVEIRAVEGGTAKATCFLTGMPISAAVEAKETAFPLLGGSRSFVNGNANWPRLGWKADFVGKFVPVIAFFYRQGDDLHLFLPESTSLRRVDEAANALAPMVQLDRNLYRNFEFQLGPSKLAFLFRGRSEVALGFLHRLFVQLSQSKRAEAAEESGGLDDLVTPVDDSDDEPAAGSEARSPEPETFVEDQDSEFGAAAGSEARSPEPEVSATNVVETLLIGAAKAPVYFSVVSARKKGNVWMARDFWTFRDVVYLARLFELLRQSNCPSRHLFRLLIDFEAKDEARTLLRDRFAEAILGRKPVLALIEKHAFHINRHNDSSKTTRIGPLVAFVKVYEVAMREETPMEEGYKKMVETATRLGKRIGAAVAEKVNLPKTEKESEGQARGALFQLRNSRTTTEFMNELARLQFRYEISVPAEVLDGETFNRDEFEEFRGFCVVAALNVFLAKTGKLKPRPDQPQ